MRKSRSLLVLVPLLMNMFIFVTLLTPVAATEEWEDVGLEWYYDNLDADDRKKIRQAMDYCIPRQQIIDGLMQGYAVPLATEVGTNILGYDATVQPREYNTGAALDLLEDVFGKRYDVNEDPNETFTNVPYFQLTLIAPTTNVARTQWASMISYALTNVGIDVELKWWNWNIIMPRLFLDPVQDPIGANYVHGGFDMYFIGFGASADPDYSGQYYNDSFAPAGDNSMYVERKDFQEIIKRSLESPTETERIAALKDYQAWFAENVPKCIIRQGLDTFPQDPDLEGFDTYNYGRNPWLHNMTHPTETTFTSLVPGDFVDFNPLVSNSWYDSVWQSNCFISLSYRRGIYDLRGAPLAAEKWTQSADGKTWEVSIREGMKFDDGTDITVEDVIYSYKLAYEAPASTAAGDMLTWFESADKITKINDTAIKFELQVFYPYVTTAVFGIPIFKKAQLEPIGMDNLKTDDTNKGTEKLIGAGPYMFKSTDGTSEVVLEKNPHWDGTLMGHDAADGRFLEDVSPFTEYTCKVIKEATAAVTALSSGECDLMDPNQGIFGQIDEMEEHPEWANIIVAPEYGWQEMAFNHYDARWGLNPHDPREMYPEDYQASPGFELLLAIIALAGALQIFRKRR